MPTNGKVNDPLQRMLNDAVILDTATPIVYVGTLVEVHDDLFVLTEADMHDCRDGHAKKDEYLAEIHREGVTVNRRAVVVMRAAVISVSRLADVVYE